VAQTPAIGESAARAAAARGLRLVAVLSPGDRATWIDWVTMTPTLSSKVRPLVALTRTVPLADLVRLVAACPDALAMCPRGLVALDGAVDGLEIDLHAAAQALGLVVVSTLEELAEAAALLDRGFARGTGRVFAAATGEDSVRIVADALERHQLTPARPADAAPPVTIVDLRRARTLARRPSADWDALLLDDQLVAHDGEPIAAGAGTLAALAAILAWPERRPPRRPSLHAARARQLLDRWPATLGEVQVKQLLACYGALPPAERLVTSASAAARAAASIGFPVTVKAVGPTLRGRRRLGAIALPVPNASACRQAFRDVLLGCQRAPTPQPLDGVLISALVAIPFALDATLVWLAPPTPPLLILRRRESGGAESCRCVACPTSAAHAERAAERLLDPWSPRVEVRGLADLVVRLSWIGPDLAGRMVWLHADTISPPDGRRPPLIIDARAVQTESRRAPC
jgi:hypothetical protein